MRPINVTLDSHTWELAKQKKNFSQWVRKQLEDEEKRRSKPRVLHNCYCELCDITYSNHNQTKMENYQCTKCWTSCEYIGEDSV